MNSKTSWQLSDADRADLRTDAVSAARRDEFARAALLPVPTSPAEGLRLLWDLLDLLTTLAGPLPADRNVTTHEGTLL